MKALGCVFPSRPQVRRNKDRSSPGTDSVSSKQYFSKLLSHVRNKIARDPDQRYYLTGHSLGGGLAEVVASETGISEVGWMSPGVQTTGFVVLGKDLKDTLRNISVTVMPEHDLVSRVDNQVGTVVKISCMLVVLARRQFRGTLGCWQDHSR
eukprot:TRINITY_DN31543_c0_g1_i1.p1 TRINITY_DN31543_c0_g1~~TRINITY_DN31543_c0_g1_i1.p1  ORF type:complete len:152 (+),score=7.72 TRINITY_DN31543_c0_g1_i1:43-498(+)